MDNDVITITINNCNNIANATIELNKNHLNIKFAPNGTGKSTIANAIFCDSTKKGLSELHSFGVKEDPFLSSSLPLEKVFIFNENFVNNIVFRESEVIEKSFEIFIKTPLYDERLKNVNLRLTGLKVDISKDEELISLLSTFSEFTTKIQFNTDGEIKNNPFFKSITNKQHLFKVPENLMKFQPFFETNYTIEWVDWKNKGFEFDEKGECPFCTEKLIAEYEKEKETFTSSYTKTNAKNLLDFLNYIKTLEEYISPEKYKLLNECITSITDETKIRAIIGQFTIDIKYLQDKIGEIFNFDSYNIQSDEISDLDKKIIDMRINPSVLTMLQSEKTESVITKINTKIDSILSEIKEVKKEIGELRGIIQALANTANKDINGFLESAGINYELVIKAISENDSKTILKYKDRQNKGFEVDKIKNHLSWGERNAFSLVLFMHYALSQNADLIILDDPISSFDNDKKYAIINRLFKNSSTTRSFYKQTVLMMTHDLEPIIDFVVNNKPTGGFVRAYHLQNLNGTVLEKSINDDDMYSQIHLLVNIISNEKLNEVYRLISLRKFIELTEPTEEKGNAYNIVSCVLHAKNKPDKKIGFDECVDMSEEEIKIGIAYIKKWIPDFSYDSVIKEKLTIDSLSKSYKSETCNFFKLQLFRIILELDNNRTKIKDDALLNYIDKTYHVENDFIYNLDFRKFEMIPEFITKKCDEFISINY